MLGSYAYTWKIIKSSSNKNNVATTKTNEILTKILLLEPGQIGTMVLM